MQITSNILPLQFFDLLYSSYHHQPVAVFLKIFFLSFSDTALLLSVTLCTCILRFSDRLRVLAAPPCGSLCAYVCGCHRANGQESCLSSAPASPLLHFPSPVSCEFMFLSGHTELYNPVTPEVVKNPISQTFRPLLSALTVPMSHSAGL